MAFIFGFLIRAITFTRAFVFQVYTSRQTHSRLPAVFYTDATDVKKVID